MKLRSCQRSYLPEDLMVNIIRRLPLKYILRFRCVNKSWYRFISSSSFINSTISNPNINHDSYVLGTYHGYYTLKNLSKGDEDESTDNINRVKFCYDPSSFGIDQTDWFHDHRVKVYGICKGLLCVSDCTLDVTSSIYLWNPVIRKAKKISMIRPARGETEINADLCFGYFHDDYKVIRIAPFRGGKYRVGVYSLSTNAWKVTYCDSDCGTYCQMFTYSSNKFVGGVAFFGKASYSKYESKSKLIGFDLNHKRIRNIQFPYEFGWDLRVLSVEVEPCGESIALIRYMPGHLIKWVLRNCAATKTSTWEKTVTLELETPKHIFPLGFTEHGKYLLRDDQGLGYQYLWDFGISSLEVCTSDTGIKGQWAKAIDSLVGNLVLLDEKTLDPFVEMEPCSTQTTCVLYRSSPSNKKRTDMLDTTQYIMHERWTGRKIGQTEMEKPRKKEGKEMLNNTQNRLRGRGTKRRKEGTKMEEPRKKERKEKLDRMQNILQGRGKRRRMEETETENPSKKGRKEIIYKTQNILQEGWGAKRRRDQTEKEKQRQKGIRNMLD